MTQSFEAIAGQLVAEHKQGTRFHKLDGLNDLNDAYRVQDAYVASIIGDNATLSIALGKNFYVGVSLRCALRNRIADL